MKIAYKLVGMLCTMFMLSNAYAMQNPAAANCVNQGNKYILIKSIGICIFPDGSYCEEWAYFRGRCISGNQYFPGRYYNPRKANMYCTKKSGGVTNVTWCKLYR